MPYSHHTHSGQFCGHAKDKLEEVVRCAISKGFHTFALTEHIPRPVIDFYPEEKEVHTPDSLSELFDAYIAEAVHLREKYKSQLNILIGFESEWIRPTSHQLIQEVSNRFAFDLFIGSVHHVHTIPIDFDRAFYEEARDKAGGTDESLFEDYFDAQYELLKVLKPPIVGHFDLIRLLSDHRDAHFSDMTAVWSRILRNLEFIAMYGGVLELNSAGLRKGLAEPYPCAAVCQNFLRLGGRFVMSDDSHGIDQVGTNYKRLLAFVQHVGIQHIHYAAKAAASSEAEAARVTFASISVEQLARSAFWGNVESF